MSEHSLISFASLEPSPFRLLVLLQAGSPYKAGSGLQDGNRGKISGELVKPRNDVIHAESIIHEKIFFQPKLRFLWVQLQQMGCLCLSSTRKDENQSKHHFVKPTKKCFVVIRSNLEEFSVDAGSYWFQVDSAIFIPKNKGISYLDEVQLIWRKLQHLKLFQQRMSKRKQLHKAEEEEQYQMSDKNLKICLDNQDRYFTPELNDVLELHYYGFGKIDNLHPYVNIHTLYLQNNIISKIENLSHMKNLITLNLSNNRITRIENLQELTQLSILDLSSNKIESVTGLRNQLKLTLLNLSSNSLARPESIAELEHNTALTCLHLSNNPLPSQPELFQHLAKLPVLTLYMKETPFSRGTSNYRKQTILHLNKLTFLDDRPVTESERKLVEAWKEGGIAKQNEVRKQIQVSKEDKNRQIYTDIRQRSEKIEKMRDELYEKLAQSQIQELSAKKAALKDETDELKLQILNKQIQQLELYLKCFRESVNSMAVGQMPEVPMSLCQRHEPQAIYIYGVSEEQIPKIKQKYYPQEERPLIARPFKKDDEAPWIKRYDELLQYAKEEYGDNPQLLVPCFNMKVHELDAQLWRKTRRFTYEEIAQRLRSQDENELQELD